MSTGLPRHCATLILQGNSLKGPICLEARIIPPAGQRNRTWLGVLKHRYDVIQPRRSMMPGIGIWFWVFTIYCVLLTTIVSFVAYYIVPGSVS